MTTILQLGVKENQKSVVFKSPESSHLLSKCPCLHFQVQVTRGEPNENAFNML